MNPYCSDLGLNRDAHVYRCLLAGHPVILRPEVLAERLAEIEAELLRRDKLCPVSQ
jgi:hypothetical protein